MRITHHPDITTIMTCSAGSQPEALCAVVTSHLYLCPECRRELALLEEIGVGLFECLPGGKKVAARTAPISGDVLGRSHDASSTPTEGEVPWPLRSILGHTLDAIQWTEIQAGIATFSIALSPNAKGDLRLLRLDPGRRLPEHGHVGEELSLVLRGSYRDEFGSFGVGDFADLDDDNRHSVLAGPDGCIILVGSETTPAFLGELVAIDA